MKTSKNLIFLFILVLSGAWGMIELTSTSNIEGWLAWRALAIQYTGVLSIGLMSISMLLAVRPVVIESYLNGLDKIYKLHKWLGITGLILSIIHWVLTQSPKWLTMLGILERKARPPRSTITFDNVLQQFFQTQRGFAESVGEWAFYILCVLLIITLAKKIFSYTKFIKTHHAMAVIYLILAWHSIVLLKFTYWASPLGIIMSLLVATGTISAIMVLLHQTGKNKTFEGVIQSIEKNDQTDIITLNLKMNTWTGHQSGQFAFLTLDEKERAHPFTIASEGNIYNNKDLQFKIKALGDYTNTLSTVLKAGNHVKVEGPYGRFNFQGTKPTQVWIAGGIGVTPFISKLKELAKHKNLLSVSMFYAIKENDESLIKELKQYAGNAGIILHVFIDNQDGLLQASKIMEMAPSWKTSDIWFCGPQGFGQELKKEFIKNGLSEKYFHQELFEFR